jgi:hypothetical protein
MFAQQWPGRKREREDDEESGTSGFSEHRTVRLPTTTLYYSTINIDNYQKRRIAALPHRTSPKLIRNTSTIHLSRLHPLSHLQIQIQKTLHLQNRNPSSLHTPHLQRAHLPRVALPRHVWITWRILAHSRRKCQMLRSTLMTSR